MLLSFAVPSNWSDSFRSPGACRIRRNPSQSLQHSTRPGLDPPGDQGRLHRIARGSKSVAIPPQAVHSPGLRTRSSMLRPNARGTESHGHVPRCHLRSWPLGAEGNGDSLIRLDIQHQPVGLHFTFAKDNMRGAAELDHDFRGALSQASSPVRR